MPRTNMPNSPMLMMNPDMPVMMFKDGGAYPNKGLEALAKEAPEVVKKMGYKYGGDVEKYAQGGPTIMMNPDMPVMRFAEGDAVVSEEEKKRFKDFQPEGMLKGTIFDYVPDKAQTMMFMMDRMGMGQPEPAQQEDSFNMLRMFMELTPEEKMIVAGPGFNEMTEDEVAMAMYNFIAEGRSITGGREVDYMDPAKQGMAGGGIVSLMDDDY